MKTESNFIEYGIYIDHKQSYIISLDGLSDNALLNQETVAMGTVNIYARHASNEEQIQAQKNQRMEVYCKAIVQKLEKANSVLIFGPSTAKFALQKKVNAHKNLKHITEEVLVSEQMTKEEALRFVEKHYSELAVASTTVEQSVQEDV
jgi:hypothetical protein